MKKTFTIARDGGRWAKGIRYGKQWVAHLQAGTVLNEHYMRWLVDRLNGMNYEPPPQPQVLQKRKSSTT